MLIDPSALSRQGAAELVTGLIAPRPIAWVSTLSPTGQRNLAPFSFFNAFSSAPFTIAVAPGSRGGVHKDSLRNIKDTGELVVNVVTEELAERANRTSADFDPEVDEWEVAGLTPLPCDDVAPPRVRESPASLECRVFQIVDLGPPDVPTNSLVVARVTRVHLDDAVANGVVPDPDALHLVGRMGGPEWCRTRDRFPLPRPSVAQALGEVSE